MNVNPKRDGALAVAGRELRLSNRDKLLFPQAGFRKGDLIDYYATVAGAALPHLRGRALTLKRYPNGVDAPFFYEQGAAAREGARRLGPQRCAQDDRGGVLDPRRRRRR